MDDDEAKYIQENWHIANRLTALLQRRRLLRDRVMGEDYDECRMSAYDLSKVLESEMVTETGAGFLRSALTDMQRACTNFVSAAGKDSASFKQDDELFRYHLVVLREVFARRMRLIVDKFDLQVTPEIQQIMDFGS